MRFMLYAKTAYRTDARNARRKWKAAMMMFAVGRDAVYLDAAAGVQRICTLNDLFVFTSGVA